MIKKIACFFALFCFLSAPKTFANIDFPIFTHEHAAAIEKGAPFAVGDFIIFVPQGFPASSISETLRVNKNATLTPFEYSKLNPQTKIYTVTYTLNIPGENTSALKLMLYIQNTLLF